MPLKDLPTESRPREKLLTRGPQALSDAELLAILLRTGIKGKGVLQLAEELISPTTNVGIAVHSAPGVAEADVRIVYALIEHLRKSHTE